YCSWTIGLNSHTFHNFFENHEYSASGHNNHEYSPFLERPILAGIRKNKGVCFRPFGARGTWQWRFSTPDFNLQQSPLSFAQTICTMEFFMFIHFFKAPPPPSPPPYCLLITYHKPP